MIFFLDIIFIVYNLCSLSVSANITILANASFNSKHAATGTNKLQSMLTSCMEDLHILFGEVKYSVSGDSEGNHVLTANVECVTGYILNGPAQVMCENPYGWPNPSKLPNCTRNDKTLPCGRPRTPRNSIVIFQKMGYFIQYKCFHGYWLQGPVFRECTVAHIWSGTEPQCVAESSAMVFLENKIVHHIQLIIISVIAVTLYHVILE